VPSVDATHSELWSYEGAGIYRHVRLVKTQGLHIIQDGNYIFSEMHADGTSLITVKAEIRNDGNNDAKFDVETTVYDSGGKLVASAELSDTALSVHCNTSCSLQLTIRKAELWSIDHPALYTLKTQVKSGGAVTDELNTRFGIRSIRFSANSGFFLNGQRVQINGMCCHQDHACVGAAVPDKLNEWRVRQLKSMGCNAIRTAHNPPAPSLLDACDRLGMLVVDEARMMSSTEEGLVQLASFISRDRKPSERHPLVARQRRARTARNGTRCAHGQPNEAAST